MVIRLDPELETALTEQARQRGLSPDELALNALRERFVVSLQPIQSHDEWEQALLDAATDCGVSLPNAAVSSEGLYE